MAGRCNKDAASSFATEITHEYNDRKNAIFNFRSTLRKAHAFKESKRG